MTYSFDYEYPLDEDLGQYIDSPSNITIGFDGVSTNAGLYNNSGVSAWSDASSRFGSYWNRDDYELGEVQVNPWSWSDASPRFGSYWDRDDYALGE